MIAKIRNLPPLFISSVLDKNSNLVKLKWDISIPITLSGSIPKTNDRVPLIIPACVIITAVCGSWKWSSSSQIETRSNIVKKFSPFGGETSGQMK